MKRGHWLIAACLVLVLAGVPQWALAGRDGRPAWSARLEALEPSGHLYAAVLAVRNTGGGAAERVQVLAGGLALTEWRPAGPEAAVWPAGEERRFRVEPLDPRTGALGRPAARLAARATHVKVRWQEGGRLREQVVR